MDDPNDISQSRASALTKEYSVSETIDSLVSAFVFTGNLFKHS